MTTKLLTHFASTLRSRASVEKAEIIRKLEMHVWPHIEAGTVKPHVYKTFPLKDARGAHELIDSGVHIGKIVLATEALLAE